MNIPQNHQVIMPYLMLNNASKFIDFTKLIFDSEIIFIKMKEDQKTIMHAEIKIGKNNGSTIMLCDATDQWVQQNSNMFVYVADVEYTYKKAIECGCKSLIALSNQDYGRTCGIKDTFGNTWWITTALTPL